ncbi:Ca(2+)-dependent cysteine protease, partial [Ascosphaera pollenicola]
MEDDALVDIARERQNSAFGRGSSTARVKTGQLWGKSKEDLTKQLEELKTELNQLRVQKIVGGASSKVTRIAAREDDSVDNTD